MYTWAFIQLATIAFSGNMSWLTQCSIDDDEEDDGGGGDGEDDGDGDGDEENYCDVDEEGDGKEGF